MTVSDHTVLSSLLRIEPPVLGINFGEVVCADWKKASILVSDEVLASVPVLHELQSLNKLLWNDLKEMKNASLGFVMQVI